MRRRAQIVLGVVSSMLIGAGVYGLWQPSVRISHITVEGTAAPLDAIATEAMQGSYLGIIPRNSILFFPDSAIREGVLAAYPGIAAVSIARNGLASIALKASERVPVARWCGASIESFVGDGCYLFDANGFVYATATPPSEDVRGVVTPFILFGALIEEGDSPIGRTLADSDTFPALFDFARHIGSVLGSPVQSILIRKDEVDFFLSKTGARVTYLLGDEQNAFAALVSAKDQLNLSDPQLQYVDLRFPGKVYLKKHAAQ